MKIRHATLLDVYGRAAKHGGYSIMAADVDLEGSMFSFSFSLSELPSARIPPILRLPVQQGYDVAWVRARLPHAFGFTPEPAECEKTMLYVGFVAVAEGQDEGIAFQCSDVYGKTSLMFSEAETEETAKAQVADAFWSILLSEPNELEDFETPVMHLGVPLTLHFGCKDGEPYCRETEH